MTEGPGRVHLKDSEGVFVLVAGYASFRSGAVTKYRCEGPTPDLGIPALELDVSALSRCSKLIQGGRQPPVVPAPPRDARIAGTSYTTAACAASFLMTRACSRAAPCTTRSGPRCCPTRCVHSGVSWGAIPRRRSIVRKESRERSWIGATQRQCRRHATG